MNIVVLCGGISTERIVSINTGSKVCEALRSKGHKAIVLDVYCGYKDADVNNPFSDVYDVNKAINKISEFNDKLEDIAKYKKETREGFFGPNVLDICKMSDIVFMALHGENGENGKVQAAFDLHDIRYTGSGALASGMAMDKGITKELFMYNNVPTPNGVRIQRGEPTELDHYNMELPVVVKPCCGGSSVGVTLAFSMEDYSRGLDEAFKYEDDIVVEEYIKGREFSVGVIAGRALPIIEIVPKEGFYDYTNKYVAGMTVDICPAKIASDITERIQRTAEKAAKVLMLGSYSRIDFLMDDKNDFYVLEANTLPGMTATSLLPQEAAVLGYSFPDLCELLIKESMDGGWNQYA